MVLTEADNIGVSHLSLLCRCPHTRHLLWWIPSEALLETSRPTSLPHQ